MPTIQELLNQQAELAKKIAAEYGKAANQKKMAADFHAILQHRRNRRDKFIAAPGKIQERDIVKALADGGWVLESGSITSAKSVWKTKDSSLKIFIDGDTFLVKNGTEIVSEPAPLANLPSYLESKPVTQPSETKLSNTKPDAKFRITFKGIK